MRYQLAAIVTILTGLFVVLSISAAFACGDDGGEGECSCNEAVGGDDSGSVTQPGAKVGDLTTCPVLKSEFTVTEDSPSAEYEGETVYFCCPGCVEPFREDPAKYLDGKDK